MIIWKPFLNLGTTLLITGSIGWILPTSETLAQDVVHTMPAVDQDRAEILVHVPVESPPENVQGVTLSTGETVPVQFGGPWLMDDPQQPHWMTCVVPQIDAGTELTMTWSESAPGRGQFQWSDDQKDLSFGPLTLLTLEDAAYDNQTQAARDLTYKVFHHLYVPGMEEPITKGPGGLYPHHRGLFYGFNRIGLTVDGASVEVDTWHAKKAHQESRGVKQAEAGRVFARQVIEIAWMEEVSQSATEFATETRELVVFPAEQQMGIQFASRLVSQAGDIELKGDPQHAGFQFRASQRVADETKDKTYYLRPDGVGKPGEFRNWPDNQKHIDLPFHGMSFMIGDRQFTCLRLDRPANPHPARFSERDYGRFGSYFEYQLKEDQPLEVIYQLRITMGEMELETARATSAGFAGTP